MNTDQSIEYWIKTSEDDIVVMHHLFQKKDYAWSLFIGHLVLEKMLKALFIKVNMEIPPRTHDLVKIYLKAGLEQNPDILDFLDRVTQFNIESRYPDAKFSFQQMCTREFTEENIVKIREVHKWLKSRLK